METASASGKSKGRTNFFAAFVMVLAAVLVAGFARTFFLQPVFAVKPLTVPLIIHGICGTSWFALLVWQARQVQAGKMAGHRKIGRLIGLPLAGAAIFSALWIVYLTSFDGKASGSGLPDNAALFIQTGTITWFVVLAVLGFRSTRRPDYHRRYMTMATIAMLAPAFSRIFRLFMSPAASPVDSAFLAVPLIGALFAHDFRSLGRPHPVTLWAGLGYLAYVALRLPMARSDLWNQTIVPAVFGI